MGENIHGSGRKVPSRLNILCGRSVVYSRPRVTRQGAPRGPPCQILWLEARAPLGPFGRPVDVDVPEHCAGLGTRAQKKGAAVRLAPVKLRTRCYAFAGVATR